MPQAIRCTCRVPRSEFETATPQAILRRTSLGDAECLFEFKNSNRDAKGRTPKTPATAENTTIWYAECLFEFVISNRWLYAAPGDNDDKFAGLRRGLGIGGMGALNLHQLQRLCRSTSSYCLSGENNTMPSAGMKEAEDRRRLHIIHHTGTLGCWS